MLLLNINLQAQGLEKQLGTFEPKFLKQKYSEQLMQDRHAAMVQVVEASPSRSRDPRFEVRS